MDEAVSVQIYVHDPKDLNRVLTGLSLMGFEEHDWCEMRRPASFDRVTYGPCPKLRTRTPPEVSGSDHEDATPPPPGPR